MSTTLTVQQQHSAHVRAYERAMSIRNKQAKKKYEEWRKKFAEPTEAAAAEPPKKTVNDLVRIAVRQSKRISSGCMKLGSKPRMTVPFPLSRVVLQNCTATHINKMLANVTSGTTPLHECEKYAPCQLPRQPATKLDC